MLLRGNGKPRLAESSLTRSHQRKSRMAQSHREVTCQESQTEHCVWFRRHSASCDSVLREASGETVCGPTAQGGPVPASRLGRHRGSAPPTTASVSPPERAACGVALTIPAALVQCAKVWRQELCEVGRTGSMTEPSLCRSGKCGAVGMAASPDSVRYLRSSAGTSNNESTEGNRYDTRGPDRRLSLRFTSLIARTSSDGS